MSRNELYTRLDDLDWNQQKKIMHTFLNSLAESDKHFTYSKLLKYKYWDKSFIPIIKELWNEPHDYILDKIIVKHFPLNFIEDNLQSLDNKHTYYWICKRFLKDKNFVIDKTRLSPLYVLTLVQDSWQYYNIIRINTEELMAMFKEVVSTYCSPKFSLHYDNNYYSGGCYKNEFIPPSIFNVKNIQGGYYQFAYREPYSLLPLRLENSIEWWDTVIQRKIVKSAELQKLLRIQQSDFDFEQEMSKIHQKYIESLLPSLTIDFIYDYDTDTYTKPIEQTLEYTEEERLQNKEALEKVRQHNSSVESLIDAFDLTPF